MPLLRFAAACFLFQMVTGFHVPSSAVMGPWSRSCLSMYSHPCALLKGSYPVSSAVQLQPRPRGLRRYGAVGAICSSGPNPEEDLGAGRRAAIAALLSPMLAIALTWTGVPLLLNPAIREQGWYKQRFADAMSGMGDYEDKISGMKQNLFALITAGDTVVELGAGLGPNLKYLNSTISYTAVEPNSYMHAELESKLKEQFSTPSTITEDIRLVPTASADVVVSTLVLCSVKSQGEILDEILRVLKPGGKLLFLEHVIEEGQGYPSPYNIQKFDWDRAYYRWSQRFMSPLQAALADGCHPDRDTVKAISEKFSEVFVKRFRVPELWGSPDWWKYYPIGPQVAGVAIKRPLSYAGELAEVQFKFCAADMAVVRTMPADVEGSEKQAAWAREMQVELAKPTTKIKCN